MPIARSSTEAVRELVGGLPDGVRDLRSLLGFRRSGLSDVARRRLRVGGTAVLLLTVTAAVLPAYLRDPLHAKHVGDLVGALPSIYLGFAVLSAAGAMAARRWSSWAPLMCRSVRRR